MNQHNNSLGNRSTKGPALNTGNKITKSKQQSTLLREVGQPGDRPDNIAFQLASLEEKKATINTLKCLIEDPFRKPSKAAKSFLKDAIADYRRTQERMIGMPTYSDNSTLQYEAPNDIPTVPLSGLVPVQRTAYIVKVAAQGTTAGGFFTTLVTGDFTPWVSVGSGYVFRVKQITSWTVPRADGNILQGTFAGVAVPAATGAAGTEVTPIWSENWEPVGQGFAGIVTKYPLGAYPLYNSTTAEVICSHYTSLGGVGGITNVPVVFHVIIETLI
jgi:hypothetical protein